MRRIRLYAFLIAGSFGLASGIFITIKKASWQEIFNSTYIFLKTSAKKGVAYFNTGAFSTRRASITKRRDLISERLSELQKERNEFIADPRFEEKRELTEDESSFDK